MWACKRPASSNLALSASCLFSEIYKKVERFAQRMLCYMMFV